MPTDTPGMMAFWLSVITPNGTGITPNGTGTTPNGTGTTISSTGSAFSSTGPRSIALVLEIVTRGPRQMGPERQIVARGREIVTRPLKSIAWIALEHLLAQHRPLSRFPERCRVDHPVAKRTAIGTLAACDRAWNAHETGAIDVRRTGAAAFATAPNP